MRAILTYHSIDESGSPISLDEAAFARHVAWLARGTVRVVGLAELLALQDGEDAVALTFDDAYSSFLTSAWPRLAEHGLPACVFVVADHVGGTNAWGGTAAAGIPLLPLLDWDELATLAEEGLELGAHSRTHRHLVGCTSAVLADELGGARERITARTGALCAAFAYPYGSSDAASVAAAKGTFDLAVTTEHRALAAADDHHRLPRLDAWYFRAAGSLERFGSAAFERRIAWRRRARAVRALWNRRDGAYDGALPEGATP